jgi:hypothetical protein
VHSEILTVSGICRQRNMLPASCSFISLEELTSWLSTLLSFLLLPIDDAFHSDDIQRVF